MRLICPNCDAEYEVDAGLIPAEGRDVQCSACGHTWFQASPEREAELEEEVAVFGAAPPEDAEIDPLPDLPPPPSEPRSIDESVLSVLREEAAREAEQRKAESMESQEELGLTAQAVGAAVASTARSGKREMLPEIDTINSTLRAKSEKRAGESAAVSETMPLGDAETRGFRRGFVIVLVLAALLVALYVAASALAARFPALAPLLTAYVAVVDSLRAGIDSLLRAASAWVGGLSGN